MKRSDYFTLAVLALLAVFIWLRDTSWMTTSDDTLPILISIPIFIWLGWPWKFNETGQSFLTYQIVVGVLFFLAGIVTNLTILLTIGWVWLLWSWLSNRTDKSKHSSLKKLLIFPLMAFPWIAMDAGQVGWWFRLSGATVTAHFFSLLGANVIQEGTQILINGMPISVEVACAGLNTLQSMLIAGSVVAYVFLGTSSRYWWNLPVLIVMAWVANTLRIIILSLAALLAGRDFALGAFHTWGGWLVLMIMFAFCWMIFALQEPKPPTPTKPAHE